MCRSTLHISAGRTDTAVMEHTTESVDIPVVILVERRQRPGRRGSWRGGRRNDDWTNRPLDAWRHLEQRAPSWLQWLAKVAPLRH
jgi:hypothetical protein